MWGWKKLGTHAHSSKSAFQTTTVFFLSRCSFSVSPSSLQSAKYSCPCKTSRFLESVLTTQSVTMLADNIQHTTNHICHSSYQMLCLTHWEVTSLVLCRRSYHRLWAMIRSIQLDFITHNLNHRQCYWTSPRRVLVIGSKLSKSLIQRKLHSALAICAIMFTLANNRYGHSRLTIIKPLFVNLFNLRASDPESVAILPWGGEPAYQQNS